MTHVQQDNLRTAHRTTSGRRSQPAKQPASQPAKQPETSSGYEYTATSSPIPAIEETR